MSLFEKKLKGNKKNTCQIQKFKIQFDLINTGDFPCQVILMVANVKR